MKISEKFLQVSVIAAAFIHMQRLAY